MKIAIVGRGELASELYSLITASSETDRYEKIFFVDLTGDEEHNVMAEEEFFHTPPDQTDILIAMGEPFMRRKMFEKYSSRGFRMTSYIHPLAYVSAEADIGSGTIAFPHVYIAPYVTTGDNTIFHTGAKIENNCRIGSNCFISLNAFVGAKAGIGDNCFIGPSASIRDSLLIGEDSIIGMGSVVTKSVAQGSVCYGNPARRVRENTTHKVFQ